MGLNLFFCEPISFNWYCTSFIYIRLIKRSLSTTNQCLNSPSFGVFFPSVISNIICDLLSNTHFNIFLIIVFSLPFFLFTKLNMIPRQQLVGLISIFGLGGLSIVMSIARIIALAISATTTAVAVWTALECSTGIMVACCPALRVLLRRPYVGHSMPPSTDSLRSPARLRELNGSKDQTAVNNAEGDRNPTPLPGPNEIFKNVEFEIESERASQLSRPLTGRGKPVNERKEVWDQV